MSWLKKSHLRPKTFDIQLLGHHTLFAVFLPQLTHSLLFGLFTNPKALHGWEIVLCGIWTPATLVMRVKRGEGSSNHSPVAQWMGWHTPLNTTNTKQATPPPPPGHTVTWESSHIYWAGACGSVINIFLSHSFFFPFLWFSLAQSHSGQQNDMVTRTDAMTQALVCLLPLSLSHSLTPLNALEKHRPSALSTSWIIKD